MAKGKTIAKVTAFDEDKREKLHYKAEAHSSDKKKGMVMVHYLRNFFSISRSDEEIYERDLTISPERMRWLRWNERHKIKWNRDDKGNIISPWAAKRLKEKKESLENEETKENRK